MLDTQNRISHRDHVHYMIEVFNVLCSVSCVLYVILDTQNLDLSLWDSLDSAHYQTGSPSPPPPLL